MYTFGPIYAVSCRVTLQKLRKKQKMHEKVWQPMADFPDLKEP